MLRRAFPQVNNDVAEDIRRRIERGRFPLVSHLVTHMAYLHSNLTEATSGFRSAAIAR